MSKWISVKERIPYGQYPVLVYVPPYTDENEEYLGYVGMAYYTSFGEGFWAGTDGNVYGAIGAIHEPTHWMPLPEKPEETAKVVVSGNCIVCGKQLNDGRLFVCEECESSNKERQEGSASHGNS